jgi:hydroxypyruvate isomerase
MIRLSANLGFLWPDRPLPDRIAAAANAGFRAVELHWPYDVPAAEVAAACKAHRLKLLALNTAKGSSPEDFGLAALPGREAEFAVAFAQARDYARVARATAIHVMAGVCPDTAESEAVLVANLRASADTAPDLTLLLEPINPHDKPGYFYHRVERAAEIMARVGRRNLRLMFDVYHVGVGQGDVIRRLETHLPLIAHVQVAAVPSRAEPDEGEIGYRAIFATLERLGYRGWVGCEYRPRGDTDAGLVWRGLLGLTPRD